MRRLVALCLVLACSGSDLTPDAQPDSAPDAPLAQTWGDAFLVWSESWCLYAARCYPDEFAIYFGTQAACITEVYAQNCSYRTCSDPYPPDRLSWLESCRVDMAALSCAATEAPTWCLGAFQ